MRDLLCATATCLLLAGCGGGYLDKTAFDSAIAQYTVLPGPKAMYMHTGTMKIYTVSQQDSITAAISSANGACVGDSITHGFPTEKCVPVAVNDKQVFSPTGIYQRQAESEAAIQQAVQEGAQIGAETAAARAASAPTTYTPVTYAPPPPPAPPPGFVLRSSSSSFSSGHK